MGQISNTTPNIQHYILKENRSSTLLNIKVANLNQCLELNNFIIFNFIFIINL